MLNLIQTNARPFKWILISMQTVAEIELIILYSIQNTSSPDEFSNSKTTKNKHRIDCYAMQMI